MLKLTGEQVDDVVGYALGPERVCSELGITMDQLREALLDHNVEQCPNCRRFTDSFNLCDEDSPTLEAVDGYCDNCREYDKPA